MIRKLGYNFNLPAAVGILSVCFSASGYAAGGTRGLDEDFRNTGKSSAQKIRESYEALRSSPEIQALLQEEGGTKNKLSVSSKVEGSGIETTKFQHYVKGIEVFGSMAMHHRGGRTGDDVRDLLARFDLDVKPVLTSEQATAIAKGTVGDRGLRREPELKIFPSEDGSSARLIYWVKLEAAKNDAAREILVDAHNGEIIADLSSMIPIAQVEVFSAKDQGVAVRGPELIGDSAGFSFSQSESSPFVMPITIDEILAKDANTVVKQCQVIDSRTGYPTEINAEACRKVVDNGQALPEADEASRQAMDNSLKVLEYYRNHHNRDSFDNRGTDSVSIVHIGVNFSNAAWISDQDVMIYGDGDGQMLGSFTAALDVAGHEMTHGVTNKTADLTYMGESGALNEAYSDLFGKLIENRDDWSLGKDLYLDKSQADGFRDLANPGRLMARMKLSNGQITKKPYPAHVKDKFPITDKCDGSNDRCYVHVNSTIWGHWGYLMIQAIGKEKSEKILYLTLTQLLNSRANFKVAATATLSACSKLYDSATCSQVKNTLAQVGL